MLELNLTAVPHVQVYGQILAVAFFSPRQIAQCLDWHRQRGGPEQSTRLSVSSIDIIVFIIIIITATNTIIIFNI